MIRARNEYCIGRGVYVVGYSMGKLINNMRTDKLLRKAIIRMAVDRHARDYVIMSSWVTQTEQP